MTAIQKKRLSKVLFATLCMVLIIALGTVLCFATEATEIDGEGILAEIVSLLTSGITDFGAGLAAGINSYVKALFVSASGGLSTTGVVIVIFAGVSLVCGITALIWVWITSLGARK